jgi:hypothetical protein
MVSLSLIWSITATRTKEESKDIIKGKLLRPTEI